jgi:dihydroorotate dehydrogenase
MAALPRYDRSRTYRWNYDHAPDPIRVAEPRMPGRWRFCGRAVGGPLGIAAGPLLNGRWILFYASLGFDVLTYKTVRTVVRDCYALPNLQPVATGPLRGTESHLLAARRMNGSWAVSFGMPSMSPEVWRRDVETTRRKLPPRKFLSVSVVGTVRPGWGLDELADDYARCARWAVESGADAVEANLSCPNVETLDGQLYQQPAAAARVAARIRKAIGATPLIAKIGHLTDRRRAAALVTALAPHVRALAMTNSVAASVRAPDGSLLFGGQPRGICGDACRDASIAQTRLFASILANRRRKLDLVGVGGVRTAVHAREYLAAGATAVHLATAAMIDPTVGLKIRKAWAR